MFEGYGEIIDFDTFLQGLFFTISIAIGIALFFTDHLKKKTGDESGKEGSSLAELNSDIKGILQHAIGIVLGRFLKINGSSATTTAPTGTTPDLKERAGKATLVASAIVFISLTMGIFVHTVGEVWMEKGMEMHLGQQYLWTPEHRIDVREKAFDRIYSGMDGGEYEHFTKSDKQQFYYFAKHEVQKNATYGPDLKKSRLTSEYSRTFAFAFFFVFFFSLLNLLSLRIREFIWRYEYYFYKYTKGKFSRNRLIRTGIVYINKRPLSFLINLGYVAALTILAFSIGKDPRDGFTQVQKAGALFIALIPLIIWVVSWIQFRIKSEIENQKSIIQNKNESAEWFEIVRVEEDATEEERSRPDYEPKFTERRRVNLELKNDYSGYDYTDRNFYKRSYLSIIFLYFGLAGYLFSCTAWEKSEEDMIYKSFGYYKNIDEDVSGSFLLVFKETVMSEEHYRTIVLKDTSNDTSIDASKERSKSDKKVSTDSLNLTVRDSTLIAPEKPSESVRFILDP